MAEQPDRIPTLIRKVILRDVKWSIDPPHPELEYTLRVAPPVPAKSLPTFHPKKRRPLTPMLRERFGFASSITLGSRTWLGPTEMAKAIADPKSREMHSTLREHWEGSAPNLHLDDRLSLFAVHAELVESRVYLVWGAPEAEPKLWLCSGMESVEFKSLQAFLRWHLA